MDTIVEAAPSRQTVKWLTPAAWVLALLTSLLPVILWDQLTGARPDWMHWVQLGMLATLIFLSFVWQPLQPLRNFAIVLIVINAVSLLTSKVYFTLLPIQKLLGSSNLTAQLQPEQFGKLAITLFMIVVLLLLGYSFRRLYLTTGNLGARMTPVKWLGFPRSSSWWLFGGQYGFYIPLGITAVLYFSTRPSGADFLQKVVPIIPAILVFAALNAFYEEFVYKASMLATLESPVGIKNAWLISALYFGIGHFYGVPYGWVGIVLATFTGWLWGKAMVETRGFCWSWWMHFLVDIVIFTFMALGSIAPGG